MPKKKGELSIEERLEQSIVAKEEEPYKLPSNWVWTTWEEISDIFSSKRVLQKDWQKEGIPFYRTREIVALAKDELFSNELFISQEHYDSLAKETRMPKAGDLMVTGIGTIGICYLVKENDCFYYKDASVLCVSKKGDINSEYLKYLMKTLFMVSQIKKNSAGTTVDSLTINKYKTYKLPLPPLEEQKRIVEKLDSLFEKIQKIKEIIEEVKEKTTSRREAILSKAFSGELTEKWRGENHSENARELLVKINDEKLKLWEDECKKAEDEGRKKPAKPKLKTIDEMLVGAEEEPYKLPNNWVWTKVGNITNYGEVKQIKAENIPDNSWILELEDIEKETFKVLNKVLKKDRPNKSNKHIFFKGDILYSKLRPYLNKIVIAEDNGYATTEIIPFKGLANLNNKYIFYYFSFSKTLETISFLTHGMQMPRLGTDKAKNLLFPLPPLEEQKEIVRVLDKVFEEENRISELISLENKIEILEKTILDRAFRGELGTGNNDDEPAIELLKKCLEER